MIKVVLTCICFDLVSQVRILVKILIPLLNVVGAANAPQLFNY